MAEDRGDHVPLVRQPSLHHFEPHPIHRSERIWSETNCYVDLWIEVLHALGADPIPATAFVFSAEFDGRQWDFVKFQPEDLRILYGIDVAEQNIWKPFAEQVAENLDDGIMSTVEVDGFYLPDTEGTSYRNEHTKTTIVPLVLDTAGERMEYFHNSGYYGLAGDDFRGALAIGRDDPTALPPYIERIRIDRDRLGRGATDGDIDLDVIRSHVRRGPSANPVAQLGERIRKDVDWVRQAGPDQFHLWSFGTLRQCGASAELAADLAAYLDARGVRGAAAAQESFRQVATGAKSVQFKMARAARGRAVSVDDSLDSMASAWAAGMAVITSAV
ncbi:DUF1839 family protein [Rhodococcoides trifolii]|uniref:DUF1839 family protein n=1 Tax=Rhodococcoides trifolii TaxID=908250 RepID=UPI0016687037